MKTVRQLLSAEEVIQLAIRLGLLVLLTIWTVILIRPFAKTVAWAIVLAVAFNPVFVRLAKVLGRRPELAAWVSPRSIL